MNLLRLFFTAVAISLLGCADRTSINAALAPTRERGDLSTAQAVIRSHYRDVPMTSTDELSRMIESARSSGRQPPIILDARKDEEFRVSHLPSAVLYRSPEDLPAGVARDATIVVYCSIGVRSCDAARDLRRRGYPNASNLDGSIFRWAVESRPMVTGDGAPATLVHPFNESWGRLLPRELHAE